MFKSRTVFVVGAGASVEIGLPTSNQLKAHIAKLLGFRFDRRDVVSGDYAIAASLREYLNREGRRSEINDYFKAAQSIAAAMPQALSIDNYLDTVQNHRAETCGKLSIVRAIIEAERKSRLYIDEPKTRKIRFGDLTETRYHSFFQLLSEKIRIGDVQKLFSNTSFIVFNYDRCIEYFLLHALMNYYLLGRDEACALINNLRINHPYGTIGNLPGFGTEAQSVPFGGSDHHPIDIMTLAGQIKTFAERIEDRNSLDAIHEEIRSADTLVFLGFAFHESNMDLIHPRTACSAKRVFATAFGISKSDCEVIEGEIRRLLSRKPQHLRVELRSDLKCGGLFGEFQRTITAAV